MKQRVNAGLSAVVVWLGLLGSASAAWATEVVAPNNNLREIWVSGDAEVKVVPDQVILTLGVDSHEADLNKALQRNEEAVKRIIAAAKGQGVEARHIQTQEMSISPRLKEEYSGSVGSSGEIASYDVHKGIIICLKDLSRFDALYTDLIHAGANRVDSVQFENTELRKYRDQARQLAMRAARDKATAMSAELGQKLGRPRLITEQAPAQAARVYGASSAAAVGGGAFAAGEISITANVEVTFDLAD
jgi:uncharacterized protein YggE